MRLVMLGTGPFAVPTLQALMQGGHEVLAVVTRPPRGRRPQPNSPMQEAGEQLGLEVWTPESVNQPDAQEKLAHLNADLLVVCDYGEILKPETLATTRLGGVNLHGSLLPKYRGAAPVAWAILNGETETGNTVIQMTPGLDAGPCLGQQRTPIGPEETAGQVEERLAQMGAELVCEVVDLLARGDAKPLPQDSAQASKAPRLKKEDGAIDWSCPAQAIKNQVRAMQPWPRTFTFWQRTEGEPLRLNVDRVAVIDRPTENNEPGTVLDASGRLIVATGDGAVELVEVQPAGKRSMAAAEFLRGYRVAAGERFGF